MTKTKQQTPELLIAMYLAHQAQSIIQDSANDDSDAPESNLDRVQELAYDLLQDFERSIADAIGRLKLKDIPRQDSLTIKVD